MEKINDVAVLIPAYKPDDKLTDLVNRLKEMFVHIIIVNDGCSEEYDSVFSSVASYAKVLVHEVNKGKGRALKTGFEYVLKELADVKGVVTVDADGQHTPEDTVNCCKMFLENDCKPVFGCRDFYSDYNIPKRSRVGNRFSSFCLKLFYGVKLSDTQTGLRVLPVSCLEKMLSVKGDRYEYEMNMIFDLYNNDINWIECPISVIYLNDNESSHFNPLKDSMKIAKVYAANFFVSKNFKDFVKFALSSGTSSLIDFGLFTFISWLLINHPFESISVDYIILSTVIARICSGAYNFLINKWIFGKESRMASAAPKYVLVWLIQMCLSAFIVSCLVGVLPMFHRTLIKVLVDLILFFISFQIQKKWVFKANENK